MTPAVLAPHKRLLTRGEAATYCGLGATAPIPVSPKRVRPGKQGLRYDVRDLDRWIDRLDSDGLPEPTGEEWLGRLDQMRSIGRKL